jgi:8-oxo-dGTP pyrophosphatase MutT (NUDIX family)
MEPSTRRTFHAVPAQLRPQRSRRASRVIVVAEGAVLMLADTDPGLPGSRWWVTPGGGIDPGETAIEAAVREVAEELGLEVPAARLVGPVAVRDIIHGYSDQILRQHETFFVLPLDERFEPSQDGHTPDELITLAGWAWIEIDELDRQSEPVWPSWVAQFVDGWDGIVHDFGTAEESTVPVE